MVYDLGDSTKWEYFFPNVDKPMLIIPPGEDVPKGEEVQTAYSTVYCMCMQ